MTAEFSAPAARPSIRWVLHAAALTGFLICVGLGTWQVQRQQWKTRLLARIAEAQTAPAEPLPAVLNRLQDRLDVDYVRVQFTCPSLEQTPQVTLYAVGDNGPARRVVTACPIEVGPYRTILVDRGFLTGPAGSASPVIGPVIGVLRRPEPPTFVTPPHTPGGDFYARDIAAMAKVLKAQDPAPIMLLLESPKPASGSPTPAPVPVNIPNNHTAYAITWYGLAAALAGVYIAFLRRSRGR